MSHIYRELIADVSSRRTKEERFSCEASIRILSGEATSLESPLDVAESLACASEDSSASTVEYETHRLLARDIFHLHIYQLDPHTTVQSSQLLNEDSGRREKDV